MEISNLIPHIESLIFASDKPLTSLEITDLINNAFGFMEDKIGLDQIESSIEAIVEKYQSEFYPFEVRQSGGGWQFLTKKDYHKTVAQLNGEKFLKRLSTASLETLSIIAYKQPVTKAEIEAIRGVSSDYAIQKLLEKDLVVITGRNETMPGHPLVYATSKSFMDYFGLNSVEDLPKLKEVFDESIIAPTNVSEIAPVNAEEIPAEETEDQSGGSYAVSENGELIIEETQVEETVIEAEAGEEPEIEDALEQSGEEEAIDEEGSNTEEETDQAPEETESEDDQQADDEAGKNEQSPE